MIQFGREITGSLEAVARREWLVTNGIGGYAMGTPAGLRTRRYHSILTASLQPPTMRTLLVAALDVWVEIEGVKHPLCTHEWTAGVLLPDGYRHLESFRLDGTIPVWTWALNDLRIVQRLWMPHGQNTTYVTFEVERGAEPVQLQVVPLCTWRDHHRETKGGQAVRVTVEAEDQYQAATIWAQEDLSRDPLAGAPRPFRVLATADTATPSAEWWWSFHLAEEQERGLGHREDLLAAATFRKALQHGEHMVIVCTAEAETPPPWQETLSAVHAREANLIAQARLEDAPPWVRRLPLAADQFIVDRQIGDEHGKSVLAGYPWFGDWGRDTMIALPGLTIAVGRPELAAEVLRTFARFVNQGMVPNRFPDRGQPPEYNNVDATLWYFEAVRAYLSDGEDAALAEALYPVLKDIIRWHERGTRFSIRVDPVDGLLYAGQSDIQLTWMDVKIGDWVVTPRTGKPVEVNALWFNALCVIADLARKLGHVADAAHFEAMAAHARESFNQRFWFEGGYLYDVIDTPEGVDDATLRPNQLIAVSLPCALVDEERARAVVNVCAAELVTSYGLRSLDPNETDYSGHFGGDVRSRDSAYHQGTVWAWLIGPFVTAHYKVFRDAARAMSYLEPFADHLMDAGLGTISEIFEGDPPHAPKGCIAQAWSVAEVLRAYRLLESELQERAARARP